MFFENCRKFPSRVPEAVKLKTDLFLYDFKVRAPEKHQRFTGHDNIRISENLQRLCKAGKTVEIRMIQLPGMNMSDEDLNGAGEFLAPLPGIRGIRLLAYHDLARSKYRAAGMPDTMPQIPAPTPEELEHSAGILAEYGLKILK